jgi:hypothetical protein
MNNVIKYKSKDEGIDDVWDLLAVRHSDDEHALVTHQELEQAAGCKRSKRYYDILGIVRARFREERSVLLEVVQGVGYKFLTAPEHGEHSMRKVTLAINVIDREREKLAMFLDRADSGEETGFSVTERIIADTLERDLGKALGTARGLMAGFDVHREQVGAMERRLAAEKKKADALEEKLNTVKGERSKLKATLGRRNRRIQNLKSKG